MKYAAFFFFISLATISCEKERDSSSDEDLVKPSLVRIDNNINQFNDYWHSGKAELSAYDFEQVKYGEKRSGNAVLIFVTEPFSKSKQVKLDSPSNALEEDNISVIKLNKIARFTTGVYDYSLMLSVFTPISLDKYPNTLKVTSTSQDWCGHDFAQLNYVDEKYNLQSFSYFEGKGDGNNKLKGVMLEDELLTRLRIDPESIPTGNSDLIPGLFFSRTTSSPLKAKKARIAFKSQNEATSQCIVEYLHLDRTVNITFESSFPHSILRWEEINDGQITVQAEKRKTIRSPYWEQHSRQDEYLRDSLGLM